MKAEFGADGVITLLAENSTEEFALCVWEQKNRIDLSDEKRNEKDMVRGSSIKTGKVEKIRFDTSAFPRLHVPFNNKCWE